MMIMVISVGFYMFGIFFFFEFIFWGFGLWNVVFCGLVVLVYL